MDRPDYDQLKNQRDNLNEDTTRHIRSCMISILNNLTDRVDTVHGEYDLLGMVQVLKDEINTGLHDTEIPCVI